MGGQSEVERKERYVDTEKGAGVDGGWVGGSLSLQQRLGWAAHDLRAWPTQYRIARRAASR